MQYSEFDTIEGEKSDGSECKIRGFLFFRHGQINSQVIIIDYTDIANFINTSSMKNCRMVLTEKNKGWKGCNRFTVIDL